jgi:phosphoserine phosphatase
VREVPVADGRPMYTAVWRDSRGTHAHCKGAAESVLALCQLPEDAQRHWQQRAADLASQGWRVLGVAQADNVAGDMSASRFNWLGLVAFEEPLRESVPAAVRLAREAGITVKMITGDAPQTALAIAREAGIVVNHGNALLGSDIEAMDDAALNHAVRNAQVFARVSPAHKLRLVRAMQANGEVVAMTGDGVNDAPALRAAHIGIGMGARGTDVAREAAALVLQDDDFGHIVQAVSQGRRIFDNLRKVMLYIVAIHVPIAGLALLPLLFGLPPLLLPAHVALTEMVIDPMCTLGYESLAAAAAGRAFDRPRAVAARPGTRHAAAGSLLCGLCAGTSARRAHGSGALHDLCGADGRQPDVGADRHHATTAGAQRHRGAAVPLDRAGGHGRARLVRQRGGVAQPVRFCLARCCRAGLGAAGRRARHRGVGHRQALAWRCAHVWRAGYSSSATDLICTHTGTPGARRRRCADCCVSRAISDTPPTCTSANAAAG